MTVSGSSRSLAKKRLKLPSYLLHTSTGQARVRIAGRDFYLGEYGSDQSRIRYGQLIAKLAGGQLVDPIAPAKSGSNHKKSGSTTSAEADPGPSVGELCLTFLRHAETHYVKNGVQTSEVHILRSVIRPLNELYGMIPAKDFGPLALKAVRAKMVELGWARTTVNAGMSRIRRIFKRAVEDELIEPSILQKLQAVAPLLAGRTEAHDNAPRQAVAQTDIEAVRSLVSPLVRDLIDVQRLTGARSGELLKLTTAMIDRTGEVWKAALVDHKCQHHGQSRTLHFGPQAQLILTKYLSADPDQPLFKILRTAYCRAITRACEKSGIDRWVTVDPIVKTRERLLLERLAAARLWLSRGGQRHSAGERSEPERSGAAAPTCGENFPTPFLRTGNGLQLRGSGPATWTLPRDTSHGVSYSKL